MESGFAKGDISGAISGAFKNLGFPAWVRQRWNEKAKVVTPRQRWQKTFEIGGGAMIGVRV